MAVVCVTLAKKHESMKKTGLQFLTILCLIKMFTTRCMTKQVLTGDVGWGDGVG